VQEPVSKALVPNVCKANQAAWNEKRAVDKGSVDDFAILCICRPRAACFCR
jgi:hypothetical protein